MKEIISLALLNTKNYSKKNKGTMYILIVCSFLFLLFVSISIGFKKICTSYNDDYSLKGVEVYKLDSEISDNDLLNIKKINHIEDIYQIYQIQFSMNYEIYVDNIMINCAGVMNGVNVNYSSFSKTEIFEKNTSYINPIIAGREFKYSDTKKAIIDENYAYILGYKNSSEIIGKTIELHIGQTVIHDIEIIGVHSYKYGYEERKYENDYFIPSKNTLSETINVRPFLFSYDVLSDISKEECVVEFYKCNPVLVVDDIRNVKEVCENLKNYYNYDSINMINVIEKRTKSVDLVSNFIYVISIILLIISLTLSINSLILKIQKQKNFTSILHKIGYSKINIIFFYVIENIIMILKVILYSFVILFISTLGIDVFMSAAYKNITEYDKFVFLLDFKSAGIYYLSIMLIMIFISIVVSYLQSERKC